MARGEHSLTVAIPPSPPRCRRLGGAAAGHAGRRQGRERGQGRQEGQGQHLAVLPALLRGEWVRGWAGQGVTRGAEACHEDPAAGSAWHGSNAQHSITAWTHALAYASLCTAHGLARVACCPYSPNLPQPCRNHLLLRSSSLLRSTWAWRVWSAAPAAPATPAAWTAPGSARCRCSRYTCSRWAGRVGGAVLAAVQCI